MAQGVEPQCRFIASDECLLLGTPPSFQLLLARDGLPYVLVAFHQHQCDVEAGAWSVECKSRKQLPGWLLDAMAQAKRNATPGTVGIVVLHKVGQRSDNDIVCLTMADFQAIAGTTNKEPSA